MDSGPTSTALTNGRRLRLLGQVPQRGAHNELVVER